MYVEFRDQCRERGVDPEEMLEEWAIQQETLVGPQTVGASDPKWAEADRRALANLSKA